ncbi:hypothetical protein CC85DRAFT_130875 [Cutaneotrichosporon oleaginosum]|uniref:Uncharacterized protein n=1 Tax=Cutaneotrichosporon oleaginosum TaxID=879819 RepID=A0A0J0XIQ5_9TREE|nr:uncharacterized protein CC85DRAFT_130875 [Cutaneotrichosporon oleaginosum]KLT40966.1 hypothetical protein CC85DRAFT_130875 [Cutaneotrichosporon oleaginosum]TXT06236.1 hypothetical protein COLE_05567 [Cutaneotrichosporon oleaginosum]
MPHAAVDRKMKSQHVVRWHTLLQGTLVDGMPHEAADSRASPDGPQPTSIASPKHALLLPMRPPDMRLGPGCRRPGGRYANSQPAGGEGMAAGACGRHGWRRGTAFPRARSRVPVASCQAPRASGPRCQCSSAFCCILLTGVRASGPILSKRRLIQHSLSPCGTAARLGYARTSPPHVPIPSTFLRRGFHGAKQQLQGGRRVGATDAPHIVRARFDAVVSDRVLPRRARAPARAPVLCASRRAGALTAKEGTC